MYRYRGYHVVEPFSLFRHLPFDIYGSPRRLDAVLRLFQQA
jgi:hypothetical protein